MCGSFVDYLVFELLNPALRQTVHVDGLHRVQTILQRLPHASGIRCTKKRNAKRKGETGNTHMDVHARKRHGGVRFENKPCYVIARWRTIVAAFPSASAGKKREQKKHETHMCECTPAGIGGAILRTKRVFTRRVVPNRDGKRPLQ